MPLNPSNFSSPQAQAHAHASPKQTLPIAVLGAHLQDYGHVRLCSPWRYNLDADMAAQLAASGWQAPDADGLPLAGEIVERVLKPFAALPAVAQGLRLNTRVRAISRDGFDKVKSVGRAQAPFVIRAEQGGRTLEIRARAVIDAIGTWGQAKPLGAGHSAANALLALAELAQQQVGTADALPARGQLGTALREQGRLSVLGQGPEGEPMQLDGLDEIICATGQRPDLSLSSELRVKLDPWLESTEALGPLIDPNLHSCGPAPARAERTGCCG